jgi:hypothetical protein
MRLIDNLRTAEKKGLATVRRHVDRAKDEWSDVERRIRQRMRIYPQKLRQKMGMTDETGPPGSLETGAAAAAAAGPGAKPIVSIDGRDIPEHEMEEKLT